MYVCWHVHMKVLSQRPEDGIGFLEVKLKTMAKVCTGNGTVAILKNSRCAHLISQLYSPRVLFFNMYFLLSIFLIYISDAIPKVPHTLPPPHPTHPLPLFGPGVPLYWGR